MGIVPRRTILGALLPWLLCGLGCTQQEIAEAVGSTQRTIADKIALLAEIPNLEKPLKVRALYEEEGWSVPHFDIWSFAAKTVCSPSMRTAWAKKSPLFRKWKAFPIPKQRRQTTWKRAQIRMQPFYADRLVGPCGEGERGNQCFDSKH